MEGVKSEEKGGRVANCLFHTCPDLQESFSHAVKRPGGCWEVPGGGHIGPTTRAAATQVVTWHRTTNRLWGNVGPKILHCRKTDKGRLTISGCCQCLLGHITSCLLSPTVTLPFWPYFVRYSAVQDVDCAYSCHFRDWCVLPKFHWS